MNGLAAKAEILSVCVSHTPEGDQGYSEGYLGLLGGLLETEILSVCVSHTPGVMTRVIQRVIH